MNTRSNRARGLVPLAAVAVVVAACGGDDPAAGDAGGADVPDRIRLIVPTSAGGGADTTARQIEPHLAEELGTTIVVENIEGGGTAIGNTAAIEPGDCSTILATALPHLVFSYLTQDVDYTLDDFAPLAGTTTEPGVIRVAADASWDSLEDLVEDALSRPGEISFSVSEPTSSNYIGLLQIEEATGADFNIVPFDGGSPARNAVVSGEVDATHAGVFNSLPIAGESKVLAVQQDENLWPDQTDGAPTVAEALGVDVEPNGSSYNLWTSAACRDDFPETYEAMVAAVEPALENEDYLAALAELGEESKVSYLDPDALGEEGTTADETIKGLLEADPDVFSGS